MGVGRHLARPDVAGEQTGLKERVVEVDTNKIPAAEKLRIGVDARSLNRGPLHGMGRYLREVITRKPLRGCRGIGCEVGAFS